MKNKVFFINLLLQVSLIIFYVVLSYQNTGQYIYPLDDPYIHLSIAKNFALDGVWGITVYEPTSSTSSPIFTFILSAMIFIFGNNSILPLIFNLIIYALIIATVYLNFKNLEAKTFALGLSLIMWLPLLHVQVLSGMEHLLHVYLALLIIINIKKFQENGTNFFIILLILMVTALVRYENLFVSFAFGLALLINKDYKRGLIVWGLSLSLPIAYGIFSLSQGNYFFPNSLLLKGNTELNSSLQNLLLHKRIFTQILIVFGLFIYHNFRKKTLLKPVNFTIFLTVILHLILSDVGWLFRYEAYFWVMIIFGLVPFFDDFLSKKENKVKITILIILLAGIAGFRLYRTNYFLEKSAQNINEQHYNILNFIQKNYNDEKIIINDLGIFTYYTDAEVFDIFGLGSNEVIEYDNKADLYDFLLSEDYKIAILYESWYPNLPTAFNKIGELEIEDNRVCGDSIVSFYSLHREYDKKIEEQLKELQKYSDNVEVKIKK